MLGARPSAPNNTLMNRDVSESIYQGKTCSDPGRSMRVTADDVLAGELVLSPGTTDPRDLQLELWAELRPAGKDEAAAAEGTGQVIRAQYTIPHA